VWYMKAGLKNRKGPIPNLWPDKGLSLILTQEPNAPAQELDG
jgi:hypothetical protein